MPRSKARTETVQVFHIPANGDRPRIIEVDTCTYTGDPTDASTEKLEESFGHVPDLTDPRLKFDLANRALFNRDVRIDGGGHGRDNDLYCIYKCITGKERTRNRHFDAWRDSRVFGDAFIFRPMGGATIGERWYSDFDEMIEFEHDFHSKRKGWAREIVKKMGDW